jgi:tetracycline 7-halogenase / FADH2 O2-dependent halogenase
MVKEYEVVILGSGISGSLLAAVLSRNGVKTALIDSGTHPRFAIGESTVPETTTNLKIMSKLFDVPEIEEFANFFIHRDKVGPSHGVKRGFSFCYHREYQEHNPAESNQTSTLSPPFGPDSHWFRQDTDQYMLTVAAQYGTDVFQQTTVTEMAVRDDGVELMLDSGALRCEFVVDGTGAFSPFAKQMGVRETPCKLETHSRGIFTHMIGVKSWDVVSDRSENKMPYRMDQTTLHHLFDGGWMWVIPFDNHEQSTNKLCSVGVMYDTRKYPKTDATPEQEFEQFLARYPSIAKQFESAVSVRKWVSTPRIQYSSTKCSVGRYFALPHAAAFIDPLFSTGLNLTAHAVNAVGEALLESFRTGRLQEGRLRMAEGQVLRKVKIFDKLVATSFVSFQSFALWNAWYRIWEIGTYFNALGAMRCLMKHRETGKRSDLMMRFSSPWADPLAYSVEGYPELFDDAAEAVATFARGDCSEREACLRIYDALKTFDAMPSFITRREEDIRTIGTFTVPRLMAMYAWGRTLGPASTRRYYDFTIASFVGEITSTYFPYVARHALLPLQPVWDMVFTRSSNEIDRDLMRAPERPIRRLTTTAREVASKEMPMGPRETNGQMVDATDAMRDVAMVKSGFVSA